MPSLITRTALVAALATAAGLVAGGSAHAAGAAGPLSVNVSGADLTSTQRDETLTVDFDISDPSVRQVTGLHVTIDTAKLPAGMTIGMSNTFMWDCTTVDTLISCAYQTTANTSWNPIAGYGYLDSHLSFEVDAPKGTKTGTGSLAFTAGATGLNTASETARYSFAGNVHLKGTAPVSLNLTPGDTYEAPFAVTNAGTQTVHGVWLWVDADSGFTPTTKFANCRYNSHNQDFCYFANDLAPGVAYAVGTPLPFQINAAHEVPYRGSTNGDWHTPLDLKTDFTGVPNGTWGTGPALALVTVSDGTAAPALTHKGALQADKNYESYDDIDIALTGTRKVDLAAVGGSGTFDAAGTPVTLNLGVTDLGTADADFNRSGDSRSDVTVTVPGGTKATAVPANCAPTTGGNDDWNHNGQPGYPAYDCPIFQDIAVGKTVTLPFTFEPVTAQASYTGTVRIQPDGDKTNDTAPITFN